MQQDVLEKATKYIDSWLAFRYARTELPGFVVAVQHKNKLIYSNAFGYADLESKTKMTTNHIFRIASHSKTFTATAIMQLQEQGNLKIDDKVVNYLGWLKEHKDKRWQNVTIRQLLSHNAGVIRDGLNADYWSLARPFPDNKDFKKEMLEAELIVSPGTKLKYSNYGYTILGLIVEAASGQYFADYIAQNIIDKLGLKSTGSEYTNDIQDKLVTGYTGRDINKQRLPIDDIDTQAMASATGFYSTVYDLCVYAAEHFSNSTRLLKNE